MQLEPYLELLTSYLTGSIGGSDFEGRYLEETHEMNPIESFKIDHVSAWLDSDGGITIKAVTPTGDPVELSSTQARELAALLIELADLDDA